MRILQLGKFYPIRGGVEKVMWDLTRGLAQKGVGCDMLCAMRRSASIDLKDAQYHEYIGKRSIFRFGNGCRIYTIPAFGKIAGTMFAPGMIPWLKRHKKNYDIIHIHHPDPMAALALRLSHFRGKVVLHWHSDIVSQKFFLLFYKPLQRWLIKRADVIIGTTPVYLKASSWLRKVQDKCVAVPIGIDPVEIDPDRAAIIKRRFPKQRLILTIGRLVPYKGYPYLIEAMQQLPEEYHLVIGGTGPMKKKLRKQVEKADLTTRVTMPGFISYAEIADWYGAADLFVLSSIMRSEAFGIVQIEAMSCGKPVVATTIPGSGVSWVNKEGVSGLNAEPRNAKALADAILLVDKEHERFSEGARNLFNERYTLDHMIEGVKAVYDKLLN